jgi:uncharacterized protein DUF1353
MQGMTRRDGLRALAVLAATPLAGCAFIRREDIGTGDLKGRVVVEWSSEDKFIYRKQPGQTLSFRPSFMKTAIVPEDMYTDGGSVPRILWGIPGLSPWGLGPAYIVHDWIFQVHRCKRPAPPEVAAITFEQSALILAEVGKALIDHNLIKHDVLDEIVWAVGSRYARDLWDQPGDAAACKPPPRLALDRALFSAAAGRPRVIDFVIPPRRR